MKTKILLAAILMISIMNLYCQIINVPDDQPTIQAGIDVATTGDTVLVAQGTYFENINYNGKAITVASHYLFDPDSANIYNTIIDGSQSVNPDYSSVVTFLTGEDTTSVLSGFTITGGTGMYLSSDDARIGGGIVCYYASAKIIHNIIEGNEVNYSNHAWGAGLASINETGYYWTVVTDNIIRDNHAIAGSGDASGGGVEIWGNARVCNNRIDDNHCISETGFCGGGGFLNVSVNNPPDTLYFYNNIVSNNTVLSNSEAALGGGVFVESSVSFISNNTIQNNQSEGLTYSIGGGIRFYNAIATLYSNTVSFNTTSSTSSNNVSLGGGVSLLYTDAYFTDNTISHNYTSSDEQVDGGGVHFQYPGIIEFEGNLISDNQVSCGNFGWGAGVVCFFPTANMEFRYNEFSNNSGMGTNVFGGGLSIIDAYDNEVTIEANLFLNNTAHFGGGFNEKNCYNVLLTNNLFSGNTSYGGGAIGLYHPESKEVESSTSQKNYRPQVINNTFFLNSASSHAGALRFNGVLNAPVIMNCIFWENNAPDGKDIRNMGSDSLSIYYSNIDTIETNNNIIGLWTGENNIFEDPLFTDEFCHLNNCESPCKNAGTDALEVNGTWHYCPTNDIDNETRPYENTLPDIGIDETPCLETSIKNHGNVLSSIILNNFPNPFKDQTMIEFKISKSDFIILSVVDFTGKNIQSLVSKQLPAGTHQLKWNVKRLPTGIYFLRLEMNGTVETKKFILLK